MVAVHEAVSRQLFELAIAGLTQELCDSRGWRLVEKVYPVLDVEFFAEERVSFRVRMTCDGWNSQPPAVSFLASDGTPMSQLPISPGNQFNNSIHPKTGKPFLCMAGAREYHEYAGHVDDRWERYRDSQKYDLGGILTQIWLVWRGARP